MKEIDKIIKDCKELSKEEIIIYLENFLPDLVEELEVKDMLKHMELTMLMNMAKQEGMH